MHSEPFMRIALFKDSVASFLRALTAAGIPHEELRSEPGHVMAAGTLIAVAQTAAFAGPIATVLVTWLKGRASRKVILTLRNRTIVHLEGYSVDQVRELLPLVEHASVVDTEPSEQSSSLPKRTR